jgi:hypothetical protein
MKPNQRKTSVMFTTPVHQKKRTLRSGSVFSPFLRHLNTGTLAFLLFVAFSLLSTTRGKEPESREPAALKSPGRGRNVLFPGPVRLGQSDYRSELSRGSLKVYSATDAFDDGGAPYYAHSSYAIYTTDGKFFENVQNRISRSDEIPEIVALPGGSYVVEPGSEQDGYVRMRFVTKEGQQTILDLDLRGNEAPRRFAHN